MALLVELSTVDSSGSATCNTTTFRNLSISNGNWKTLHSLVSQSLSRIVPTWLVLTNQEPENLSRDMSQQMGGQYEQWTAVLLVDETSHSIREPIYQLYG